MEVRRYSQQHGSLEKRCVEKHEEKPEDVVSMADSSITIVDIEGELSQIESIRNILVRRESELRYMMDDVQLCREITELKKELQKIISVPEEDKSRDNREREEELLQQLHKLVETRDFLVEDVEFERLREREEDKEMGAFLQSKLTKTLAKKNHCLQNQHVPTPPSRLKPGPYRTKTGLTLLKDCCGLRCSVM
ncbi:bMERB domain-containing protein 1 isoform X2 [Eucyclogobius newberryi]|uniref:bMERB domain-containing protein 1 isoform X2 n=1 Tax=Eucyclogobius newberryi TaxID=166745 RepID=UPI003B5A9CC3